MEVGGHSRPPAADPCLDEEAVLLAVGEVADRVARRGARGGVGSVAAPNILGDGVCLRAVDGIPGERHLAAAGGRGRHVLGGRRYIIARLKIFQAVSFFALVPILPTGPVDGLLGITLRNVINNIVAESSYKNFIRHRVIDAGILEEPICTIIITIVDIRGTASCTKQVDHAPAKALNAIGAIVQVDSKCLKATTST